MELSSFVYKQREFRVGQQVSFVDRFVETLPHDMKNIFRKGAEIVDIVSEEYGKYAKLKLANGRQHQLSFRLIK